MNITNIDWNRVFKQNPKRYLRVFDEKSKELVEVHDLDTGNIWFRIDEKRWMFI